MIRYYFMDGGAATGITSTEEFITVLEESSGDKSSYPGELGFWEKGCLI